MKHLEIVSTIAELRQFRDSLKGSVGFIPTMGALHEGHKILFRRARKKCEYTLVSIFVNPTQFGADEDFLQYPKTLEADFEILRNEGIDAVFIPSVNEMYPKGLSTFVEESQISMKLCGKFRPGHFKGVGTIVLKLLNLVRPNFAFFGMKDAQQYYLIQQIVQDLNLQVKIVGVETAREKDGFAYSSRNRYLSAEERKVAPFLYRNMVEAEKNIVAGMSIAKELDLRSLALAQHGFKIQYLEIIKLPEFFEVAGNEVLETENSSYLMAVAAFLGKTRLIDNILIGKF